MGRESGRKGDSRWDQTPPVAHVPLAVWAVPVQQAQ